MTVKITKPALNLREELADLRKPSGVAGEALLRADSVQEQRDLIGAGRKNLIINGDNRVNQRGFDGNWNSAAAYAYGYDRWFKNGSSKSQVIESLNFKPSTTYTLSGDGLTTSQITSPATGNWYITIPFSANNIQVELGSVATEFEHRSYGEELALCQRYFWRWDHDSGISNGVYASAPYATGNHRNTVTFPVTLRTSPTVTFLNGTGSCGVDYRSPSNIGFYGVSPFRWDDTTAGYIAADAEL